MFHKVACHVLNIVAVILTIEPEALQFVELLPLKSVSLCPKHPVVIERDGLIQNCLSRNEFSKKKKQK